MCDRGKPTPKSRRVAGRRITCQASDQGAVPRRESAWALSTVFQRDLFRPAQRHGAPARFIWRGERSCLWLGGGLFGWDPEAEEDRDQGDDSHHRQR